jgi:hypothetical protein
VSSVKFELGFYIPEDGILHSHCRKKHRLLQRNILLIICPLSALLTSIYSHYSIRCKIADSITSIIDFFFILSNISAAL